MKFITRSILLVMIVIMTGSTTKNEPISIGIRPGDHASGIQIKHSGIKGKYTLLQFWAAYDPESRFQNTLLHNKLKKLQRNDIQLASISFDESIAVYEETVKADKLDLATQFHNTKGKKSFIYEIYNLDKGFINLLIDPHGVILTENIKPENLEATLSKYLK